MRARHLKSLIPACLCEPSPNLVKQVISSVKKESTRFSQQKTTIQSGFGNPGRCSKGLRPPNNITLNSCDPLLFIWHDSQSWPTFKTHHKVRANTAAYACTQKH